LKPEVLEPSTLREAFADLLRDISTSARTIGALVQQATR